MRYLLISIFLIFLYPTSSKGSAENDVDIVFCLDMSGSTNGLIPDFKEKLWEIINEVHKIRPYPKVRIGLIGFSRPSFSKSDGYVKILCHLTGAYDQVVYELNALKPAVEKGDQMVGAALEMAGRMSWSSHPKALRVVYLMGNGVVNAGGSGYRQACEKLLKRNIFVNSIYCVQKKMIPAEIPGWKYIADNTGGAHFVYKIGTALPVNTSKEKIEEMKQLNEMLTYTYIPFGITGKERMKLMLETDRNSLDKGEAYYFNRLLYKTSDYFQMSQSGWDLINYVKTAGCRLGQIDHSLLPDSVRNLNTAALEKLVLEKKEERGRIISRIKTVLPAWEIEARPADSNSLQGMVIFSIHKLARDKWATAAK